MASNLLVMAPNLLAMVSILLAMASTTISSYQFPRLRFEILQALRCYDFLLDDKFCKPWCEDIAFDVILQQRVLLIGFVWNTCRFAATVGCLISETC